jgi:hypothetical protein
MHEGPSPDWSTLNITPWTKPGYRKDFLKLVQYSGQEFYKKKSYEIRTYKRYDSKQEIPRMITSLKGQSHEKVCEM